MRQCYIFVHNVTFFFTSIPDEYRSKDMYDMFKKFGDIDEVIIPRNLDKNRRRYGFVRFFSVRNLDFLATKLDVLFLGSRKLFVNTPRFKRNKGHGFMCNICQN